MALHNKPTGHHNFALDKRLQADCIEVADLALSRLLLMNDSQYPWFILVPRRAGVTEIFQLTEPDQLQLQLESTHVGRMLIELFAGDKLNVAALGNVVAQLHVHHVVRYKGDIAWPDPVWGKYPAQPYAGTQANEIVAKVRAALAAGHSSSPAISVRT